MKTDLRADLTAVGAIYILGITLVCWLNSHYKLQSELSSLKAEYHQAKIAVVELDTTNTSLHESLISMNKAYDELEDNFYSDVPRLCKVLGIYVQLRNNIKP